MRRIDDATALEAGLLVSALAMAAGGLALMGSRIADRVSHGRRHGEPPPEAGVVPPERHRHVATTATR